MKISILVIMLVGVVAGNVLRKYLITKKSINFTPSFLSLGKDCPGEGWELEGKKCFKFFTSLHTQEDGLALCESEFLPGLDVGHPRVLQVLN